MAVSEARIELPTMAARGRTAVAVTFVTLGLTYGIWYSYSVFLVALLRDFGWSRSVLAGAFSLFVMVHGLSGPVLGWLVERYGPRRVIVTGAALIGAGLALAAETRGPWQLYLAFGVIAAAGVSAESSPIRWPSPASSRASARSRLQVPGPDPSCPMCTPS